MLYYALVALRVILFCGALFCLLSTFLMLIDKAWKQMLLYAVGLLVCTCILHAEQQYLQTVPYDGFGVDLKTHELLQAGVYCRPGTTIVTFADEGGKYFESPQYDDDGRRQGYVTIVVRYKVTDRKLTKNIGELLGERSPEEFLRDKLGRFLLEPALCETEFEPVANRLCQDFEKYGIELEVEYNLWLGKRGVFKASAEDDN